MAKTASSPKAFLGRPGLSIESREGQMVSLAMDRAEEQLRDGTASSQIITHFLKLGTSMAELEREKLRKENLLTEAKVRKIDSERSSEELLTKAIAAFGIYSGQDDSEDYYDEDGDYEYDDY